MQVTRADSQGKSNPPTLSRYRHVRLRVAPRREFRDHIVEKCDLDDMVVGTANGGSRLLMSLLDGPAP